MVNHSWSGWPGAWCLNCGLEDPYEQALADGLLGFDDNGEECYFLNQEDEQRVLALMECPEPGSGRFNPYRK